MKFILNHLDATATKYADFRSIQVQTISRRYRGMELSQFHNCNEILDYEMKKIPHKEPINFAKLWGLQEDGDLPINLTQTERVLTKYLWGKILYFEVVLLVAALENMSIEDVKIEIDRIFKINSAY